MPLLKKIAKFSYNNSWSGRDQSINGNLVMHILADKTDEYDTWLQSLDENVRYSIERRISLDQALGMIQTRSAVIILGLNVAWKSLTAFLR